MCKWNQRKCLRLPLTVDVNCHGSGILSPSSGHTRSYTRAHTHTPHDAHTPHAPSFTLSCFLLQPAIALILPHLFSLPPWLCLLLLALLFPASLPDYSVSFLCKRRSLSPVCFPSCLSPVWFCCILWDPRLYAATPGPFAVPCSCLWNTSVSGITPVSTAISVCCL